MVINSGVEFLRVSKRLLLIVLLQYEIVTEAEEILSHRTIIWRQRLELSSELSDVLSCHLVRVFVLALQSHPLMSYHSLSGFAL